MHGKNVTFLKGSVYYLEGFKTEIAVFITFIKNNETYKVTIKKQFPRPLPRPERFHFTEELGRLKPRKSRSSCL
jgi:hypothetical protein